MAREELELTDYDVAGQRISQDVMLTYLSFSLSLFLFLSLSLSPSFST